MTLGQQAGYNLHEALLYLLIAILIGEQLLAWSTSYHPPGAVTRDARGPRTATPRRRLMNSASWLLLADPTLYSKFEFGRIQNNSDWILPIGGCLMILLFVRAMYRRDSVELPLLLGWFLTLLRAATFLGLLFLFLQPQWRTEAEITHNSRVALLLDTSLSMGLNDSDAGASAGTPSRIQQVAAGLAESDLLAQLRKTHNVAVFRFNNALDRDTVSLAKLPPQPEQGAEESRATGPGARTGPRSRPANGLRKRSTNGGSSSSPPAPRPGWARPCNSCSTRSAATPWPAWCW